MKHIDAAKIQMADLFSTGNIKRCKLQRTWNSSHACIYLKHLKSTLSQNYKFSKTCLQLGLGQQSIFSLTKLLLICIFICFSLHKCIFLTWKITLPALENNNLKQWYNSTPSSNVGLGLVKNFKLIPPGKPVQNITY